MIGGLRKVRAGDPVRRSASAHNAMLRAAEQANRSGEWGTPAGTAERPGAGGMVVIKAGGTALARWAPFALGTAITTPGADADFLRLPAFNAAAVTANGAFGVMATPAAANECGVGVLCGVIPAQVTISSATHKYAKINSSLVLESASTGYARILYAAGTSGSQWCLLSIGGGGGGGLGDGTATGQIVFWNNTTGSWDVSTVGTLATGDMLQWDGSKYVKVTPTQITVLTSWRLDKTNHVFQVKTRTGYVMSPGTESAWTNVTDADGGMLDEGVTV